MEDTHGNNVASIDAERSFELRGFAANRPECNSIMTTLKRDAGRYAGGAGVVAAIAAALCCAGAPILVSVLAATGLSFLRRDAILLPVIVIALLIALWGFWRSWRVLKSRVPFTLGIVGSLVLVAGVMYLHGFLAKPFIGAGTLVLLVAAVWNERLPQACERPADTTHSDALPST